MKSYELKVEMQVSQGYVRLEKPKILSVKSTYKEKSGLKSLVKSTAVKSEAVHRTKPSSAKAMKKVEMLLQ